MTTISFIARGKHGLLAPDQWIEPFDPSLMQLSRDERRQWAREVLAEIEQRHLAGATFYLDAGKHSSGLLTAPLSAEQPLADFGIGKQPA